MAHIDISNQSNARRHEPLALERIAGDIGRYLHLALSSPLLANEYQETKAGGSHTNKLNLGEIPRLQIPLPPLAEQARIVARVDELMRLCDALEAKGRLEAQQHARLLNTLLGTLTDSRTPEELAVNWQRVAAHFDLLLDRPEAVDALEQTILQLAVRGLLVPQDPRTMVANAAGDEKGAQIPHQWTRSRLGNAVSMLTRSA